MTLHHSTFEYLQPTHDQVQSMLRLRQAAKVYADTLERELPDGPDKTYVLRRVREIAMWVNVGVTRYHDGTPREG